MAVTSLALALHETTTNAAKYGALSEPTGSISVTWATEGENLQLDWKEAGGPVIVGPPSAKGFGSVLAERSISDQLGGRVEHSWLPSGLTLRVSVPLDRLAV
jgi:two-component sensor histidine kinase